MDEIFLTAASTDWLKLAIDAGIKSSLLIALVGLLALFLRRSTASLRTLVWFAALSFILFLPITYLFSPIWHVPLIPDVGATGDIPLQVAPVSSDIPSVSSQQFAPLNWLLIIWLGGAALLAVWILLGRMGARLLVNKADPEQSATWTRLMDELKRELDIGHRPVRLVHSKIVNIVMTTGIKRPTIVLPRSADSWSPFRRRLVLLHELAHIKRCDTFFEAVAELVIVLYWFNPLVWLAVFRFRIERECACDDCVINAGARASDYAWQLMDIAASLNPGPRAWWPIASVSLRSHFKDRLLSILDPAVKRQGVKLTTSIVLLVPLVLIALSLAAISPWESDVWSGTGDGSHKRADLKADEIVRDLGSTDPEIRTAAYRNLDQKWSGESEMLILEALNLPNAGDRDRVIDVLAGKSKSEVLRVLKEIYRHDNRCTRSIEQYSRLTNRGTTEILPATVSQRTSN